MAVAIAAAAVVIVTGRCSGPTRPTTSGSVVFVGAGDIANRDTLTAGAMATAAMIDAIDGAVFTLGDNAYPGGNEADYRAGYHPSWGRFRGRTYPTPGNHDYDDRTNRPVPYYYDYFGSRAGTLNRGYYSVQLGAWTIFSLNSKTDVSEGSVQWTWLKNELQAVSSPRSGSAGARCTLAMWHKPLFSSGGHGNILAMRDLWQLLYDYGAEVVLAAHDHIYERFAPQDTDGRPDPVRGIRQFIVGTGGGDLTGISNVQPNSEARLTKIYGVLKLTLSDGSYAWEFLPVGGGAALDIGSGSCH